MLWVKVFATKPWNDTFDIGNLFVSKVVSHLAHEFFVSVHDRIFFVTMAPPAKRQKHLKEASFAAATDRKAKEQTERRKQAVVVKWEGISGNLAAKKETLTNRSGKARTFEENKMLLLALRVFLDFHLKMVNLGVQDAIIWTTVENEVASLFGARRGCVAELRQQFLVSGKVVVRERLAVIAPEPAADKTPAMSCRANLSPHHLLSLC
jgi:hypothetical protein